MKEEYAAEGGVLKKNILELRMEVAHLKQNRTALGQRSPRGFGAAASKMDKRRQRRE